MVLKGLVHVLGMSPGVHLQHYIHSLQSVKSRPPDKKKKSRPPVAKEKRKMGLCKKVTELHLWVLEAETEGQAGNPSSTV